MTQYVIPFQELGLDDLPQVGGKNASLGEMIRGLSSLGVSVPDGFATTADAFREFLRQDGLDARIREILDHLDTNDVEALASTGKQIREWIGSTPLPSGLREAIGKSYRDMCEQEGREIDVAVRSSATAEDLPDASFAGQQETFLNVRGVQDVLDMVRTVFASLFNDRAISYRVHKGFVHHEVALSVGVQRMVRSDLGASGVMFTIDTESGFPDVVFITSAYGLGETVVQGAVNPDEYYVYKPALEAGKFPILRRNLGGKAIKMIYSDGGADRVRTVDVPSAERRRFSLTDEQVQSLARQAMIIEKHYQRPMDIEWGLDGSDGQLYILQARPETVQSQSGGRIVRCKLKERGEVLTSGRSIGNLIGSGPAKVIGGIEQMSLVREGDVLVTDMTDPDWEPVMKLASAIVTNRGGRTCHAAIIARELGIPAVVGTGDGTRRIEPGAPVTVSCAEGDEGFVYGGRLEFERSELALDKMPDVPVKLMMNVGNPDRAFDFAMLPHRGVGLARLEFIINRMIGVHPKALLELDAVDPFVHDEIRLQMAGFDDPVDFYVRRLAEGIATIGAAFAPEPVIVRLSDFKSNEYANLIGGDRYEPNEENPMLGFRGASRYIAEEFRPCFELECRALRMVREEIGLNNVWAMVPFVRTVGEAKQVRDLLAANDLESGRHDLKIMMMCELPSNALLAEQFLEFFDGFSIGSNDLTQLTLGLDRDSGIIAELFDERDEAVKMLLTRAIDACRKAGKYVGICGQGPSDHPDLAQWLLDQGIESMSLNPDTVVETWIALAEGHGRKAGG
ncbi:MAG: phosphoenolpyruvate synthase [Pseudomonadota bacterium]